MASSAVVATGDIATAAQYNNLRIDVLDTSSGHSHTGTDSKDLGTLTADLTISQSGASQIEVISTAADAYLILNSDTDEGQDSEIIFEAGGTAKGRIEYSHHATANTQVMSFFTADNAVETLKLAGNLATFATNVTVDGDLTFTGAQTITTSSGNLTIDTAGSILQEVGGVSKQQIGTLTTTGGYVSSVVTQQSEDGTAIRNMSARYVIDLADSITSAVTVATFTVSATSSKYFRAYVHVIMCGGSTGGVGDGAILDRVFYIDVSDANPTVGTSVSGTADASAPAVTITNSGTTGLLQVASNNGSGAFEGGLMIFELYHPTGHGNATIAVT